MKSIQQLMIETRETQALRERDLLVKAKRLGIATLGKTIIQIEREIIEKENRK